MVNRLIRKHPLINFSDELFEICKSLNNDGSRDYYHFARQTPDNSINQIYLTCMGY